LTVTVILVIYHPHFRLVGELEDEGRENRLSASRASCSNAGRSDAYNCTKLHWQIDLDVFYNIRLQTAMIRRGRGVIKAATGAGVIKLFSATACSVRQDAL
jgi:hypothetical protein